MEDITCDECIEDQLDGDFAYLTPKILDTYKKFLQDKIKEALYNKTDKLTIQKYDTVSIICKCNKTIELTFYKIHYTSLARNIFIEIQWSVLETTGLYFVDNFPIIEHFFRKKNMKWYLDIEQDSSMYLELTDIEPIINPSNALIRWKNDTLPLNFIIPKNLMAPPLFNINKYYDAVNIYHIMINNILKKYVNIIKSELIKQPIETITNLLYDETDGCELELFKQELYTDFSIEDYLDNRVILPDINDTINGYTYSQLHYGRQLSSCDTSIFNYDEHELLGEHYKPVFINLLYIKDYVKISSGKIASLITLDNKLVMSIW